MTYALQCTHLSKTFGTTPALIDTSLSLQPGRLLALLGPSGGGKTTMLRLIAGFETPDQGEIRIQGRVVAGNGVFVEPEVRRVGMVFQDYALFPHLTVAQNIGFGLNRDQQARVEAMLALVGLAHLADRMPYALSGGQQQRVALARALAPEPALVLLDEPFSNLDTALRAHVRADIRRILHETGTTAVFVTHDQQEAFSLADEVGVLMDGRIVQLADPQTLYFYPADHTIAAFVGEASFLPGIAAGSVVSCALGELPLHQPVSGAVDVLLRPEALRLHAVADGQAQVMWREFYGHDQRLGLRLAHDGPELVARLNSQQEFIVGQQVDIHVLPPVHVLPRI